MLKSEAHRIHTESLRKMGALLNRVRRDWGDDVADLPATNPAELEQAVTERLAALHAMK